MLRSARGFCILTALATGGLVANTAHADLIDPNEAACSKAGEACEVDGKTGTCVADTCSKLVYGGGGDEVKGPDGKSASPPSNGPTTRSYDCVTCKIGAVPPAAEDTKEGETQAVNANTADAKADAKPEAEADKKADTKPATADGKPPASKSGCSIDADATSLTSLALGLALLGFAARRRNH